MRPAGIIISAPSMPQRCERDALVRRADAKAKRPGLDQLLADPRHGQFRAGHESLCIREQQMSRVP